MAMEIFTIIITFVIIIIIITTTILLVERLKFSDFRTITALPQRLVKSKTE